jgi:hypothetical protein
MDLSGIISNLNSLYDTKVALKTAIAAKITVPDGSTFRNYANLIYKIENTSASDIVSATAPTFPSNTSTDDILVKIAYTEETKVWIKTALRARGIDTTNKTFSQFSSLITNISLSSTIPTSLRESSVI